MTGGAVYILKGQGQIDPLWVRDSLMLFKESAINIRKLILLKNGQPDMFSLLEIQFVLPSGTPPNHSADDFMQALRIRLANQSWHLQSLVAAE